MREYFVWLFKTLTLIILVFVVVPILLVSVITATSTMSEIAVDGRKSVAVIELNGVIENSKDILEELYRQADNKAVKGIVLAVDSPGGAVGPSQDIYRAVAKLKAKKPIVAVMKTVAASGGLYSALGASKILAQSGTMTGSIGVIMQIPNFKKFSDWLGVNVVTVKSGELKDVGNSFRDMTPEERDFLQKTVTRVHADFVQAVIESRGLAKDKVLQFADGRVILGSQAKELKLIDDFGDVYDGARLVFELAGEPLGADETPVLIYPTDKFGNLRRALEAVLNLPTIFSRQLEFKYMMY